MNNVGTMSAIVYSMCSFHTPNVLLLYTLSNLLRMASMDTPPICFS